MYGIAMVLAMAVMGVNFLISQVLILREFLVVFQGNEFSFGIVLGSWLLLEALGSVLAGRRADRARDPLAAFATVQVVLSLVLPLTVLLIRMNRHLLGISPWEVMSYLEIWAVSFAVLGPLGLVNGASFTFGCRLMASGEGTRARAAGTVYGLESLGAFAGGLAFTFLLVGRVHAIAIAFGLGALTMGCVLLLFRAAGTVGQAGTQGAPFAGPHRRLLGAGCLALAGFFLAGLATPLCNRVQEWATEQRWLPLALEESGDSIYGNVAVLKLGGQKMLYQNGMPTITLPYPDTAAMETLAHLPLLAHPDPKEVLVLGGGVGGLLAEVLKHPIQTLYYTELDPLLIRLTEKYATPSVRQELNDPRTRVLVQDARFLLRRTRQRVDVVIINLPDASTLQLNRFFTEEFFRLVRGHLKLGGILALSMPGSSSYLSEELLRMNRCVRDSLEQIFPYVRALAGERILYLASRDVPVDSLTPGLLASRLERRRLETFVVSPYYLSRLMDPWLGRWLQEGIDSTAGTRTNRDLEPTLLYYTLAYRNAEVQPGFRGVFTSLERLRVGVLAVGLLAMNLPFALWVYGRRGDRTPALSYAILSTGFVGLAMEMVVILVFQSFYGYLYQWIGLLIAVFMSGLACGALLVTRMLKGIEKGYRFFCILEVVQLAFVLVSAVGVVSLHGSFVEGTGMTGLPKIVLFCINAVAGLLVGCEFPLANREAALGAEAGSAIVAGRLYALDLTGAWLGTLLVSVLLVPLIGIGNTLLFAGALKVCSLYYLYRSR
jgi:spermidine synthase